MSYRRRRRRRCCRARAIYRSACESLEPRRLLSNTIYVDVNSPGPARDGTGWGTAYTDLQLALTAATSGDRINIADGTYKPTSTTNRSASFNLKNGVAIYGGYGGYGAINPDARDVANTPTILSGDIGAVGNATDNSYHVVTASAVTSSTIVDGVTITAGNANGTSNVNNTGNDVGGGMLNASANPVLNDCTFSANVSTNFGGGVVDVGSSPTFTACAFNGNTSLGGGGLGNSNGSSPVVVDCSFTNNAGDSIGGGLCDLDSASIPTIDGCTFTRNSSSQGGGLAQSSSSVTIKNCLFDGNVANSQRFPTSPGSGGGVYISGGSASLINCIFSGNTSPVTNGVGGTGGGLAAGGTPKLINCTFTSNSAAGKGGGIYLFGSPTLTNVILWGDTAPSGPELYQSSGVTTATYCDVQGGMTGSGNVAVNPAFDRSPAPGADGKWGTADDDYGDLRLSLGSPCVDVGSNAAVPAGVSADLAGNARVFDFPGAHDPGAIVDIGAYELGWNLGPIHGHPGEALALPSGGYAFTADQLTLDTGGTLDLHNDQLTASVAVATIQSYLQSGQLFTSSTGGKLGYLNVGGGQTEVRYTLAGDTNLDGKVDVTDLGNLASSYGKTSGAVWVQGDTNLDGKVDVTDLGNLASNYGATVATSPAAAAAAVAADLGTAARPAARPEVGTTTIGSASPFGDRPIESLYRELEQSTGGLLS